MPNNPRADFEIGAIDRATGVLNRIEGKVGSMGQVAARAGLLIGGVIGARSIGDAISLTNEYTRLQNRVEFLTRGTNEFDSTYQGLLQTVFETGGALGASVANFNAIDRVADKYKLTNEQVLLVNSNLQKLGAIGGTSLEAQERALFQLSQFFGEGILRAEEYNSIIDQAPEIIRLLEQELGQTGKTFRQLVVDGEIFADDVIRALLDNTGQINEQFTQIPTDLDRAFNVLESSIGAALTVLDENIGATGSFSKAIQDLALSLRLATGTATRLDEVQRQIAETENQLEIQTQRLTETLRIGADEGLGGFIAGLVGAEAPSKQIETRIAALRGQLSELNAELKDITAPDVNTDNIGGDDTGESEAQRRKREAAERREQRERSRRILFAAELARLEFDARDAAERELFEFDLLRAQGFQDQQEALRVERESSLFEAKLERRQLEMEEELALELGFASTRDQALQEQEDAHQDALLKARLKGSVEAQKAALFLKKFEAGNAKEKTQLVLGMAQQLTAGAATESEKAFKLNKVASLGNAIINTAQGVTEALKLPFPVNLAAAAIVAAAGAAQIATINATSFGGGSSGTTSVGAGSGVPSTAGESPLREIPVFEGEDRSANAIEIKITADGSDAIAQAVIESIEGSVREGDSVLISDGSRQAEDLSNPL